MEKTMTAEEFLYRNRVKSRDMKRQINKIPDWVIIIFLGIASCFALVLCAMAWENVLGC